MKDREVEEIKRSLDELSAKIERIEALASKLEELERKGTLDMLVKMVDDLTEAFLILGDAKTMKMLALLMSAFDSLSEIDPNLITMIADSISPCVKKTERPEFAAKVAEPPKIGILGLISMLRDPDVQRLIGLTYFFAKSMGGCFLEQLKEKAKHLRALYEERERP